jgi:hypothetical protein
VTFTVNVFEIFRFLFIFGWVIFAAFVATMAAMDDAREGKVFAAVAIPLLLGSAVILYLGRP